MVLWSYRVVPRTLRFGYCFSCQFPSLLRANSCETLLTALCNCYCLSHASLFLEVVESCRVFDFEDHHIYDWWFSFDSFGCCIDYFAGQRVVVVAVIMVFHYRSVEVRDCCFCVAFVFFCLIIALIVVFHYRAIEVRDC